MACASALLLAALAAQAESIAQINPEDIPPGFENLMAPQTTLVDVYYAEKHLGSFFAEYTPTGLRFLEPELVIAEIDLLTPQASITTLAEYQEINSGLICSGGSSTGCGYLEPESVGLIFDESQFRVDLFFHPDLLKVSPALTSKYLPEPNVQHSFVQNLSLLTSGDNDGNRRTSLSGTSIYGNGPRHVKSEWSVNSEHGFLLESGYYREQFKDTAFTGGLFRPALNHSTFLRGDVVLGAEYASSTERRTDLGLTLGTPLQIFVPTRARVNILRDGKLIATGVYEPGNQQLDTSSLPTGAYDVDIEIIEMSGRVTVKRRFYVKSAELPPMGERYFNLLAGDLRLATVENNLPESLDIGLLAGGLSHRFTETLGASYGLSATNEGTLAETNGIYLARGLQLRMGLMAGTDSISGVSGLLAGQYRRWSTNISYLKVHGVDDTHDLFPVLQTTSTQVSVTGSHPFYGGNLGGRYSFSEQRDETTNESYSIYYSKPLWSSARDSLFLRTEFADSEEEESFFYVRLSWSRTAQRRSYRLEPELRTQEEETGDRDTFAQLGFNARWYNEQGARNQYSNEVSGQLGGDIPFVQGTSQYAGEFGRLWGTMSANEEDVSGDTRISYTGRYDASLLYAGGVYAWGGYQQGESGVIVALEGDEAGEPVKLSVNGSVLGQVAPGRSLVLGLKPFNSYKVALAESEDSFVDIEGGVQSTILYPGTVATMAWKVAAVDIVVGRLVRNDLVCLNTNPRREECKIPIGPGRLQGTVTPGFVDEGGYFQAEILRGTDTLTLQLGVDSECRVQLPEYKAEQGIAFIGDLPCEAVNGKAINSDTRMLN